MRGKIYIFEISRTCTTTYQKSFWHDRVPLKAQEFSQVNIQQQVINNSLDSITKETIDVNLKVFDNTREAFNLTTVAPANTTLPPSLEDFQFCDWTNFRDFKLIYVVKKFAVHLNLVELE